MPSRWGILAIFTFWLLSTTWLVLREGVPLFRAGEPPPFFVDVSTEVGGTSITWKILHKGTSVGAGYSEVKRRPDRGYEFKSELVFEKFQLLKTVEIKKTSGRHRIDRRGALQEVSAEVKAVIASIGEVKAEVKAVVQDGVLRPRFFFNGVETDLGMFQPEPLPVATYGNVMSTMQLLNKIPGLWLGRSWKVPLLDPMGLLLQSKKVTSRVLIAEVKDDELEWQGNMVRCWRIDYAEPGQKATAHTWARRGDGLVLQQYARHGDEDLTLVREVTR